MKEKIKVKSKQNYRSISNRDTPINMLKLKKKYIEEVRNKFLMPKYVNYTNNTQDEVNYAEKIQKFTQFLIDLRNCNYLSLETSRNY